jgi:hypothetical protein
MPPGTGAGWRLHAGYPRGAWIGLAHDRYVLWSDQDAM